MYKTLTSLLLAASLASCSSATPTPANGTNDDVEQEDTSISQHDEATTDEELQTNDDAHEHSGGTTAVGQCREHALALPEVAGRSRPGHEAAYDLEGDLEAARAERLSPRPGEPLTAGEHYAEAQNPQGELSTGCSGTHCAWHYVPSATYRLEGVELHGTSAEAALIADDCGRPGQVLARATLRQGNDPGWVAGRFEQPVVVEEGRPYWLWHSAGSCSTVTNGAQQVYWCGSFQASPESWSGPWRSFAWTARLSGMITRQ